MKRFIKVYNGVYAPVGHLDEDVHILSMKARNAASDDVLIRVQNFGGDVKPLKLSVDSTNAKGFLVDGVVSEVRGRSISANQPSNAVIKRLHYPTHGESVDHSSVDIKEEHKDENQNTEEEGVFLSGAAMQKLEEDKSSGGRRRLQSAEKSHALALPPYQVRTYFVEMEINGEANGVESSLMLHEGKKNAGGAASVKARVAPLVPPTQEEDSQKKVKEDLEKHLELTQQKDDHVDGDHLMLPRGDDNAIASPVKPMKVNTDDDDWGMFEKKVESQVYDEMHSNVKSRSFQLFVASVVILGALIVYLKFCRGKSRKSRRRRKATPKKA